MKPQPDDKTRNFLGGIYIENTGDSDTLGIALASYFESHMDRPEKDVDEEGESGWGPWAIQKTNEALDTIARVVLTRHIPIAQLEYLETLASETKKEFIYSKETGRWHWHNRGEDEWVSTGFTSRLDALMDAVGPYLEENEH